MLLKPINNKKTIVVNMTLSIFPKSKVDQRKCYYWCYVETKQLLRQSLFTVFVNASQTKTNKKIIAVNTIDKIHFPPASYTPQTYLGCCVVLRWYLVVLLH